MPVRFNFNANRPNRTTRSRGNPIFGLLAGLVFIGISIPFTLSNIDLLSNGEITTGMVAEIVTKTDRKGKIIKHPKIEFMTAEGEKISFVPATTTAIAPHRIGQRVEVIYKKEDPSAASINDFLNMWIMPGIMMMFGLIISVISVFILINKHKSRTNPSSISFDFKTPPTQNGPPNNPPPTLQ